MTSKPSKPLLYQQAVKTVQKKEKQEQLKKINQEYQQLVYDSQIQKTNEKAIMRIKKAQISLPSAHSMGTAAVNHHITGILENYIKKKKYHPKTLKEIETYTKTGRWPPSFQTEV